MNHAMLACGPYFDESGLVASLVLFLLIKPLSYFAYIRAFRYRVCSAIPMPYGRAVKLAILRAVLGLALVGGGAFVIANYARSQGLLMGWAYMYVSRIFASWIVGRIAQLRGWRMVGWIAGGEVINIIVDIAVVAGLAEGVWPAVAALILICGFIYILEWRGRRPALLARFSASPHCLVCSYNLTGNLSGICPECGTPIRLLSPAL